MRTSFVVFGPVMWGVSDENTTMPRRAVSPRPAKSTSLPAAGSRGREQQSALAQPARAPDSFRQRTRLRPHSITADVEIPSGSAAGVRPWQGGIDDGCTFFRYVAVDAEVTLLV